MTGELKQLIGRINEEIDSLQLGDKPKELYEPIDYIMRLGGKRLRPLMALLAYRLFKPDWESILRPALAIEVFHNFTLMHDDIMDHAPLRRGQQTVHEKWNDNIAILSGDVMFVKAYDLLLECQPEYFRELIQKFNQCAREVCEGQQFDMNFESRQDVTETEYLEMIRLKTAVLLGFSLEMGAILAGADQKTCEAIRDFGVNIGIGFQLKDDLLDVYADQDKFGKQVGGDIIANKKTFLLIEALEKAEGSLQNELNHWLGKTEFDKTQKVEAVTAIYDQLGIQTITENRMNEYFDKGFQALDRIPVAEEQKEELRAFAQALINREK
jgi:geranylgeranyl diphosphate synthase, type II